VPLNYHLTTFNDPKPVALAGGQDYVEADFGYLPPSSISGYVYSDANNNGTKDVNEVGIFNASVTLKGVDYLNQNVELHKQTDSNGYYSFSDLLPSNGDGYTVTEDFTPPPYLDGRDAAGTVNNVTVGSAGNDIISAIKLNAGNDSINNNFGELLPGRITGFVYVDVSANGIKDLGESGINSVTLTLTGTNDLGPYTSLTTTNSSGFYSFGNLRPGTYQVRETQPTSPVPYKDGLDTKDNLTPISGSKTTDVISGITIVAGQTDDQNNFGELLPATVSGYVYIDVNNNGHKAGTGETGIGGVNVTLIGINDLGNSVSLTTTTGADGLYSFGNLRPSSAAGYTVTETQMPPAPPYYVDGKDTKEDDGINSPVISGSGNYGPNSDVIPGIVVGSGGSSANNNFGELLAVSVSGNVYVDSNNDGVKDSGEAGIGGVLITLTGTDYAGGNVSVTTTTDGNTGAYSFTGLRPSNLIGYTVTETTQPVQYADGKDTAGIVNNVTVGTAGNEFISGIELTTGGLASINNNFGERLGTISGAIYNDTATPGVIGGVTLTSGTGVVNYSFHLATTNAAPQGTADPMTLTTSDANSKTESPLAIDLNGNGIQTVALADSTGTFDLLGDGSKVNSTWLSSGDGFLAVDKNGNGNIDNISELFGGLSKSDGFADLESYDSNGDGQVDLNDHDFANLKIWLDANSNHQTDSGELRSLTDAGVVSLNVNFTEQPFYDAQGNLYLQTSNASLSDGSAVNMSNIYFNVSVADAVAAAGIEVVNLATLVSNDPVWMA
jgi:hypothetical protein